MKVSAGSRVILVAWLGLALAGCAPNGSSLFGNVASNGGGGNGGNGGGGNGAAPTVIYGGLQSGSIAALINNPTSGALSSVSGQPFFSGTGAALGIATGKGFVFASDAQSGNLSEFSISATSGALTALSCPTLNAGQDPVQMTTDATGKFVLVVSHTSGTVNSYSVGNGGCLAAISNVATDRFPNSLALDSTGNFLLVVTSQLGTTSSGALDVFKFNASTGQIGAKASSLAISSLNTRVFAGKGTDAVYVTSTDPINDLFQFALDTTTGKTSLTQNYAANTQPGIGGFDSTGKLLFLPITGNDQIFIYHVAADGTLTTAAGSPVSTNPSGAPGAPGSKPFQAQVDPSGKFLYVAGEGAGDVSAFTFTSAGALTAVTGSPFTAGAGLASITQTLKP